MGEFDLIDKYFVRPSADPADIALGIGDDCALLAPKAGMQLAVSTDLLVEGRHFLSTVSPERLGHKALAVNLSDLAACGARPLAFTLALSLPQVDEGWLAGFSRGLFALADAHDCALIGGDTTRGPLSICITVFGEVPAGAALLRSGAKAGDDVYVSGTLGDARLALDIFRGSVRNAPHPVFEMARDRLERPTPRVALGQALRRVASSAIDVSDGLSGDLGHILQRSGVGAVIDTSRALDLLASRSAWMPTLTDQAAADQVLDWVVSGGDDYELAFTAPPGLRDAVAAAAQAADTRVTRIGVIRATPGLQWVDAQGRPVVRRTASFDHFK